jgi:hypothetical protein
MTIKLTGNRLLAIYSGVLTLVLALVLLTGAPRRRTASFGSIDVQRINVVEPDGTVRLVLSSKALFPGILFKKKEYPHPNRKTAGILFYNDEGTENGGLTFGGEKDKDGKASAYGHLSFDQYDQDQVLTLDAAEDGGDRRARLSIWDRPEYSIGELLDLPGVLRPARQSAAPAFPGEKRRWVRLPAVQRQGRTGALDPRSVAGGESRRPLPRRERPGDRTAARRKRDQIARHRKFLFSSRSPAFRARLDARKTAISAASGPASAPVLPERGSVLEHSENAD